MSALVWSALVLIGCAAGPDSGTSPSGIPIGYPTIASTDFNGMFEIIDATVDGMTVALGAASTSVVEFDVVTGAATVDLGCDRRLGSFTLDGDQRASITLTGRIEVEPCTESDLDDVLWDLIGRLERWEPADNGFRLVAANGDGLILRRA